MLFDNNGRYKKLGTGICDYAFNAAFESALPNWLSANGSSPILTFNAPSSSEPGSLSMQTKSSTPTSGDTAGIITDSISSGQYSEICAVFENILLDSGATATNCELVLQAGDGSTTGFIFKSNSSDGSTSFILPPAAAVSNNWLWMQTSGLIVNATKKKNIGVVIRQLTGEVYITAGDPANGAGVIGYSRGFVNFTGGISLSIVTKASAQRSMRITDAKLSLCQI